MADDESLDQEIDQELEPTPFISKALIGRFLAVGVFVALGTFAVIQSVSNKKDVVDEHQGHDHTNMVEKIGDGIVDTVATVGDKTKKGLGDFLDGADKKVSKTASAVKEKVTGISSGFGVNSALRPNTKPSTGFAARPATKPVSGFSAAGSSGFSTKPVTGSTSTSIGKSPVKKSPVDPLVKKTLPVPTSGLGAPFGSMNLTAAKPGTVRPGTSTAGAKPPERLAQLGNGGFMPAVGKEVGAVKNAVTDRAKPAARPPLPGFRAGADQAANSFGDLKKTINTGINTFANQSQSVKNVAQTGVNRINQFGGSVRDSFAADKRKPAGSGSGDAGSGDALSRRLRQRTGGGGFSSPDGSAATAAPSSSTAAPSTFGSAPKSFGPPPAQVNAKTSRGARDPFGSSKPVAAKSPSSSGPRGAAGAPLIRRSFDTPQNTDRGPTRSGKTTLVSTPRQSFSKPQNDRPTVSARPSSPGGHSGGTNGAVMQLASTTRTLATPGERRLEGVQAPSLTIEKVSPREIQVQQPADFEIRVRNVGRVAADNVMVIDRVPDGTEFMGAEPQPQRTRGSGLQWDIGTLTPGQEKRIRYQLKPTQPGEIGSVAQVVFATRASMRTVVTKPVLSIEHDTAPKVLMGDNFVFDVIVENQGDGAATDVIIQEEVPAQLEYQAGFRQLEYEVGTLLPGQKKKLRLALRAGKVGKFKNVMYATGKGGLEARHALDLEVVAPEIRVTSEGPNRRFLQRKATHQFTVENRGTAKATNVGLVARLPSGLRYVSADNRGRYDSQSHAVYWKMPELTDGVAGTVEITTVPVSVGQQNIKFEADADLKLFASTDQELVVEHLIDVFFDIDDVIDPIEIGSQTSYRMRVLNQGTKAASNVQLQVDFPQGLMPDSVDGNLRHQIKGQRVIFEPISSLPPGQEVTMSVTATGKAPGDHRVVANIRADGREVAISKEDTTRVYSDR